MNKIFLYPLINIKKLFYLDNKCQKYLIYIRALKAL